MTHDQITQEQASRAWANLSEAAGRARVVVWACGHARDLNAAAMMLHLEKGVEALGYRLTPITPVAPHGGEADQPKPMEARHEVATPSENRKPVKTGGLSVRRRGPRTF